MSVRRFVVIVMAWAVVLGLATTGLGAILGFFVGVAIAMFGGGLGVMVQKLAPLLGFDLDWSETGMVLAWGIGALLAVLAAWTLAIGLAKWMRGDMNAARAQFAAGLSVVAFPLACWLSVGALVRAWP